MNEHYNTISATSATIKQYADALHLVGDFLKCHSDGEHLGDPIYNASETIFIIVDGLRKKASDLDLTLLADELSKD